MNIIGRTTKDVVVNTLSDGRKVVNFSIAVNDRFRQRGEVIKTTTYYDCAYWLSERLAEHLKKGTLVEVTCRVHASAYLDKEGQPKASLKCHASSVRIHGWPKDAPATAAPVNAGKPVADDDLPF